MGVPPLSPENESRSFPALTSPICSRIGRAHERHIRVYINTIKKSHALWIGVRLATSGQTVALAVATTSELLSVSCLLQCSTQVQAHKISSIGRSCWCLSLHNTSVLIHGTSTFALGSFRIPIWEGLFESLAFVRVSVRYKTRICITLALTIGTSFEAFNAHGLIRNALNCTCTTSSHVPVKSAGTGSTRVANAGLHGCVGRTRELVRCIDTLICWKFAFPFTRFYGMCRINFAGAETALSGKCRIWGHHRGSLSSAVADPCHVVCNILIFSFTHTCFSAPEFGPLAIGIKQFEGPQPHWPVSGFLNSPPSGFRHRSPC